MSDIKDVGMAALVEHRSLEALVFQWDGTDAQAVRILSALQPAISIYGGTVHLANARVSLNAGAVMELGITRNPDSRQWVHRGIRPRDFIAIWLHREAIQHMQRLDEIDGEALFRPLAPIVQLFPRTPPEVGA